MTEFYGVFLEHAKVSRREIVDESETTITATELCCNRCGHAWGNFDDLESYTDQSFANPFTDKDLKESLQSEDLLNRLPKDAKNSFLKIQNPLGVDVNLATFNRLSVDENNMCTRGTDSKKSWFRGFHCISLNCPGRKCSAFAGWKLVQEQGGKAPPTSKSKTDGSKWEPTQLPLVFKLDRPKMSYTPRGTNNTVDMQSSRASSKDTVSSLVTPRDPNNRFRTRKSATSSGPGRQPTTREKLEEIQSSEATVGRFAALRAPSAADVAAKEKRLKYLRQYGKFVDIDSKELTEEEGEFLKGYGLFSDENAANIDNGDVPAGIVDQSMHHRVNLDQSADRNLNNTNETLEPNLNSSKTNMSPSKEGPSKEGDGIREFLESDDIQRLKKKHLNFADKEANDALFAAGDIQEAAAALRARGFSRPDYKEKYGMTKISLTRRSESNTPDGARSLQQTGEGMNKTGSNKGSKTDIPQTSGFDRLLGDDVERELEEMEAAMHRNFQSILGRTRTSVDDLNYSISTAGGDAIANGRMTTEGGMTNGISSANNSHLTRIHSTEGASSSLLEKSESEEAEDVNNSVVTLDKSKTEEDQQPPMKQGMQNEDPQKNDTSEEKEEETKFGNKLIMRYDSPPANKPSSRSLPGNKQDISGSSYHTCDEFSKSDDQFWKSDMIGEPDVVRKNGLQGPNPTDDGADDERNMTNLSSLGSAQYLSEDANVHDTPNLGQDSFTSIPAFKDIRLPSPSPFERLSYTKIIREEERKWMDKSTEDYIKEDDAEACISFLSSMNNSKKKEGALMTRKDETVMTQKDGSATPSVAGTITTQKDPPSANNTPSVCATIMTQKSFGVATTIRDFPAFSERGSRPPSARDSPRFVLSPVSQFGGDRKVITPRKTGGDPPRRPPSGKSTVFSTPPTGKKSGSRIQEQGHNEPQSNEKANNSESRTENKSGEHGTKNEAKPDGPSVALENGETTFVTPEKESGKLDESDISNGVDEEEPNMSSPKDTDHDKSSGSPNAGKSTSDLEKETSSGAEKETSRGTEKDTSSAAKKDRTDTDQEFYKNSDEQEAQIKSNNVLDVLAEDFMQSGEKINAQISPEIQPDFRIHGSKALKKHVENSLQVLDEVKRIDQVMREKIEKIREENRQSEPTGSLPPVRAKETARSGPIRSTSKSEASTSLTVSAKQTPRKTKGTGKDSNASSKPSSANVTPKINPQQLGKPPSGNKAAGSKEGSSNRAPSPYSIPSGSDRKPVSRSVAPRIGTPRQAQSRGASRASAKQVRVTSQLSSKTSSRTSSRSNTPLPRCDKSAKDQKRGGKASSSKPTEDKTTSKKPTSGRSTGGGRIEGNLTEGKAASSKSSDSGSSRDDRRAVKDSPRFARREMRALQAIKYQKVSDEVAVDKALQKLIPTREEFRKQPVEEIPENDQENKQELDARSDNSSEVARFAVRDFRLHREEVELKTPSKPRFPANESLERSISNKKNNMKLVLYPSRSPSDITVDEVSKKNSPQQPNESKLSDTNVIEGLLSPFDTAMKPSARRNHAGGIASALDDGKGVKMPPIGDFYLKQNSKRIESQPLTAQQRKRGDLAPGEYQIGPISRSPEEVREPELKNDSQLVSLPKPSMIRPPSTRRQPVGTRPAVTNGIRNPGGRMVVESYSTKYTGPGIGNFLNKNNAIFNNPLSMDDDASKHLLESNLASKVNMEKLRAIVGQNESPEDNADDIFASVPIGSILTGVGPPGNTNATPRKRYDNIRDVVKKKEKTPSAAIAAHSVTPSLNNTPSIHNTPSINSVNNSTPFIKSVISTPSLQQTPISVSQKNGRVFTQSGKKTFATPAIPPAYKAKVPENLAAIANASGKKGQDDNGSNSKIDVFSPKPTPRKNPVPLDGRVDSERKRAKKNFLLKAAKMDSSRDDVLAGSNSEGSNSKSHVGSQEKASSIAISDGQPEKTANQSNGSRGRVERSNPTGCAEAVQTARIESDAGTPSLVEVVPQVVESPFLAKRPPLPQIVSRGVSRESAIEKSPLAIFESRGRKSPAFGHIDSMVEDQERGEVLNSSSASISSPIKCISLDNILAVSNETGATTATKPTEGVTRVTEPVDSTIVVHSQDYPAIDSAMNSATVPSPQRLSESGAMAGASSGGGGRIPTTSRAIDNLPAELRVNDDAPKGASESDTTQKNDQSRAVVKEYSLDFLHKNHEVDFLYKSDSTAPAAIGAIDGVSHHELSQHESPTLNAKKVRTPIKNRTSRIWSPLKSIGEAGSTGLAASLSRNQRHGTPDAIRLSTPGHGESWKRRSFAEGGNAKSTVEGGKPNSSGKVSKHYRERVYASSTTTRSPDKIESIWQPPPTIPPATPRLEKNDFNNLKAARGSGVITPRGSGVNTPRGIPGVGIQLNNAATPRGSVGPKGHAIQTPRGQSDLKSGIGSDKTADYRSKRRYMPVISSVPGTSGSSDEKKR